MALCLLDKSPHLPLTRKGKLINVKLRPSGSVEEVKSEFLENILPSQLPPQNIYIGGTPESLDVSKT